VLLLLPLLLLLLRYKDELGHAIVNFARVVPDGLLVFFPAYGVMQSCLDHWKASSGTGEHHSLALLSEVLVSQGSCLAAS
jgi:regulator of telomere elongation helicase 1